jgi:hypothetical protein
VSLNWHVIFFYFQPVPFLKVVFVHRYNKTGSVRYYRYCYTAALSLIVVWPPQVRFSGQGDT